VRLAVRADQRDAGAGLAGDNAVERAAILGDREIIDVACFDRAVRVEDGDEQPLHRFVRNGGKIGANLLADLAKLVACGAGLGEQLGAARHIGLRREGEDVFVDELAAVGAGGLRENLGGNVANFFVLVHQ
jgi:hypothetical protein